ncbi:MAG: hypothetical protein US56_C0045G0003 [Candidatus Moranbacteria bacterium GW2011_GWF2_37_7]|nr:MAG: hypothetical protein US56_C0045G0003 [Candidatus Moranbacteria bacterium GW2011_GWF2_37_7]
MSSYFKKQFFIAFIYLIIFSAIGGGIFFGFVYSPASCQDGKLNQGEEEIDCGGPCVVCQEELLNPKIVWAKIFPVEGDLYDLAAQIENKNINHGTDNLPFVFKVYDSNNNLILEKIGRSYIMPREKKYVMEAVSLDSIPAKIALEFGEIKWQKFKLVEDLNLSIFDQSIDLNGKNNYAAFAKGTVYNKTRFDLATVDIYIVIYDLRGNAIVANKTQKDMMKSGEGKSFEVAWPKSFASDSSRIKTDMKAHTNAFSDANFITTFLEK